jgi:hypothetical protein
MNSCDIAAPATAVVAFKKDLRFIGTDVSELESIAPGIVAPKVRFADGFV